ncbi:MAG: hypothetical protein RIK87_18250 [Fuerstiella sp.]
MKPSVNIINRRRRPSQARAERATISPAAPACRGADCRRGSLLVEMVVCTIMLSVVAAVLVPGIHAIHKQRKATRFDTCALIELNNLAVQIAQAPTTDSVVLSDWFSARYPDASLEIAPITADEAADSDLTPIRIAIVRPGIGARPDVKQTLVTWVLSKEQAE